MPGRSGITALCFNVDLAGGLEVVFPASDKNTGDE